MITATERPWNSATSLYIARRVQAFARHPQRTHQSVGHGLRRATNITEYLHGYGYDQYWLRYPRSTKRHPSINGTNSTRTIS
ncbi:MAG: hypothetical protein U0694_26310 [Anaerolineae bacterium]